MKIWAGPESVPSQSKLVKYKPISHCENQPSKRTCYRSALTEQRKGNTTLSDWSVLNIGFSKNCSATLKHITFLPSIIPLLPHFRYTHNKSQNKEHWTHTAHSHVATKHRSKENWKTFKSCLRHKSRSPFKCHKHTVLKQCGAHNIIFIEINNLVFFKTKKTKRKHCHVLCRISVFSLVTLN